MRSSSAKTFTISSFSATVAALLAAHVAYAQTGEFRRPYEEIRRRVETVAVATINVHENIGDHAWVQTQFAPIIRSQLVSAGFTVVDQPDSEALWAEMRAASGGFFNILTGRVDHEKRTALWDHWVRELQQRYDVDAILSASINTAQASFSTDHEVTFCGRTMSLRPADESAVGRALLTAFVGSVYGTTPVSCLVVSLNDTSGVTLYLGVGGIEPLAQIRGLKAYDIPKENRFAHSADNLTAVRLAILPLSTGSTHVLP